MKRPVLAKQAVARLWLHCQGLSHPRGTEALSPDTLTDHLERTGALQMDSVNIVDRAHHLTLWSRFGPYDRRALDRWVYEERIAYEYWGHEASILPISHLPLGRRRMRRFPPERLTNRAWWPRYTTSTASKRRVLRRLRSEGPLESADFERQDGDGASSQPSSSGMPLPKEDGRSLKLLWHDGRVAITGRRHFRCLYDVSGNVYPPVDPAPLTAYRDSWLLIGLRGNGVSSEKHLTNYFTAPDLSASERKRVIRRNLKHGRIVEVNIRGSGGTWYALPEHLEALDSIPEPRGTTLISPFDSLLWQRRRAEELLDFDYRVEIYVPRKKRRFGYYVMPILHDGRLVGRLDPKLHRDRRELEIKAIFIEPGFERDLGFDRGLGGSLESLARFVGADRVELPSGWRTLV
jgi:uncharacterized protein YcaQ